MKKYISNMIPDFFKKILRPIYRGFNTVLIHIKRKKIGLKNVDDILNYWKQPWDGRNRPSNYLNKPEAHKRSQKLVATFKKYAGLDSRILEPGCNVGRNLNYLFNAGFTNLEGIEINKDAVELLKKSYPEMARKIIIHNQAIEDVIKGFKDDAFDVVFTMAILQHIHPKSEWIFSEIVRITKSFLIIREAEGYISWRHFPRNYKKIFERLGMKQIEAYNSERIFKKV